MNRHVLITDLVIDPILELEGFEIKRKQRRMGKRCFREVIETEIDEYENYDEWEHYDESHMEVFLDEMTPWDSSYNDEYNITTTTDSNIRSVLYDVTCTDGILDSSSDSGFSEESIDDRICDIVDDTCKQLLTYCENNSDRLNAVIISSLLQEYNTELFVNAGYSVSGIGVPSLMKFAHGGGDLHTSLCAVLAWINKSETCQNVSMAAWCRSNGVKVNTLKRLMEYVNNLDHIWKNLEITCNYVLEWNQSDRVSHMLMSACPNNICYYLGHPDLGYKSFLTGHQIPCCPASSLRLLDDLPQFVISCKPRHQHFGHEQMCQYMLALDDNVGLKLANEYFPESLKRCDTFINDKVSEVCQNIRCGTYTCCKLRQLWKGAGQDVSSLQQRLTKLIGNDKTVLDIINNRDIKIFAHERYHKQVLEFIQEQIHIIRLSMPSDRITAFPNKSSGMMLMLCPGVQCKNVYFPGDNIPKQAKDYSVYEPHNFFHVTNDVGMTVQIDTTPSSDVKGSVMKLLKKTLTYVHNTLWKVEDIQIGKSDVTAQLVFKSSMAARKALELISEEPNMTITNKDTEYQCRSMMLHINGTVFSTMADALISKLDNFSLSQKYNIQYDITVDSSKNAVISITTMNMFQIPLILQKIQHLFVPTKYTPARNKVNAINIRSETGTFLLDYIGKLTGNWILLSDNIHDNVIYIYGHHHESKKAATLYLQKYMNGNVKNVWIQEGKPLCSPGVLPRDFLLNLSKNAQISSDPEHDDDSFIHVDSSRKMIWTQAPTDKQESSGVRLREDIVHLLHNQGGVELSQDQLDFAKDTCVCCLSDTSDSYVLEGCGHVYCYECINTQIDTSARENIIPICCAECTMPFSLIDLQKLIKSNSVPNCKQEKIYQAALAGFVLCNQQLYGFCPNPNCSGVFNKQPRATGSCVCCICETQICPMCFLHTHRGMECSEFMKLGTWAQEDPRNRKKCPNCTIRIEKIGGCTNMMCQYCKKSMCWACLKYDDCSRTIQDHIRSERHYSY